MRRREGVGGPFQLALGERPQLDDLHPAGQGVGEPAQRQHLGGPGEQELPGTRVGIDGYLDRPEQPRSQLNLIDHHEAVVLDEAGRIVLCSAQRRRIVQQADHGVRVPQGGDPGQGALAGLPGAVERDDPRIGQGLGHEALRALRGTRSSWFTIAV